MTPTDPPTLYSAQPDSLFDRLDLDQPDLAPVKAHLAEGDRDSALAALLAHYRARFPLPQDPPPVSDETLAVADDITNNTFQFLGYAPVHYPEPIDWQWDPRDDIEWVACMYRFNWAIPLAEAYAATRDERYPAAFVRLASDWIEEHPLEEHERTHRTLTHWEGFAWLDIQTGRRATMICRAFPALVHGESFTPDFLAILLASLYDHQVKSERIPMDVYHNKAVMEAKGMVEIAAMFPEFEDAKHWLIVGAQRAEDNILGQTTTDGVQREWSFGYHEIVLSDGRYIVERMRQAGLTPPAALVERLHRMYDFLYGIATPELDTPMFGDTKRAPDESYPREERGLYKTLQQGADMFAEQKYAALAEGRWTDLPEQRAFAWTEAGLYALRDRWTPSIYFALHNSPEALSGHDQPDNGTFELYAYGRWLMTDTGFYTYGHDKAARAWHRQTRVHQTLTLDGQDHQTQGVHRLWQNEPDLVALCVENAAYEGLLHRRTVWFLDRRFFVLLDQALGEAQGDFDLHFQFAPGPARLDPESNQAHTAFPAANVLVQPAAESPVILAGEPGWHAWDYNKRVPRIAFRYRHQAASAPLAFCTLLIPYYGSAPPPAHVAFAKDADPTGDRVTLRAVLEGKAWELGLNVAESRLWSQRL